MRRTIPLWITGIVGFVLIIAFFVPETESWGEKTMMWFDILAAIAFILGGGNLLKIHLKKISDRVAGWGYSAITLVAFFVTLGVGLLKIGVPPSSDQQFYGETFARVPLDQFPFSYAVAGQIPDKPRGQKLHPAVRRQTMQDGDLVRFVGWMTAAQREHLLQYKKRRQWHQIVQSLYEQAQPPEAWRDRLRYYADRQMLSFRGHMTEDDYRSLRQLSDSPAWQQAVEQLYRQTQGSHEVPVPADAVPPGAEEALGQISPAITVDRQRGVLRIVGPMSLDERARLMQLWPRVPPLSADAYRQLIDGLASRGPLSDQQRAALELHTIDRWRRAFEESQPLADRQRTILEQFAADEAVTDDDIERLLADLQAAGPWNESQTLRLRALARGLTSEGQRRRQMHRELLEAGSLTDAQQDWLLQPFRRELSWRRAVDQLFADAHRVKYAWSGKYDDEGSPFWWLYEYAFKPLTATMFAMLAFYVASAAFRAFRAKNVEAALLLGTAFIILLGRTPAGVVLTAWLPDALAFLRVENLTITIMKVFNTAGNRAIMIGIALGIASTSLKVLLGIDRSYLGTGEE